MSGEAVPNRLTPVGRKQLPHETPPWIDPEAGNYFITICCQQRRENQLCLPEIGEALLASARFYQEQQKWYPSLFLLMPDHLHMLVHFGRGHDMTKLVRAWKHYTAIQHGIAWQRDFFEHRLRSDENIQQKADYISNNPVRAGLVAASAEWPFVLALA